MKFLILAAFVGLALAGDDYGKGKDYVEKKVEYGYEKQSYGGKGYEKGYGYENKQAYHGKYGGKCAKDGFYYNDEYSFVTCSNGNSYAQRCAPGSKNSGYKNYQYGKDYYYHDFCDVNLVDHGYGVNYGHKDNYGSKTGYGYETGYGYGDNYNRGGYGDNYGYRGDSYGYGGDSYGYRGNDYRGGARFGRNFRGY